MSLLPPRPRDVGRVPHHKGSLPPLPLFLSPATTSSSSSTTTTQAPRPPQPSPSRGGWSAGGSSSTTDNINDGGGGERTRAVRSRSVSTSVHMTPKPGQPQSTTTTSTLLRKTGLGFLSQKAAASASVSAASSASRECEAPGSPGNVDKRFSFPWKKHHNKLPTSTPLISVSSGETGSDAASSLVDSVDDGASSSDDSSDSPRATALSNTTSSTSDGVSDKDYKGNKIHKTKSMFSLMAHLRHSYSSSSTPNLYSCTKLQDTAGGDSLGQPPQMSRPSTPPKRAKSPEPSLSRSLNFTEAHVSVGMKSVSCENIQFRHRRTGFFTSRGSPQTLPQSSPTLEAHQQEIKGHLEPQEPYESITTLPTPHTGITCTAQNPELQDAKTIESTINTKETGDLVINGNIVYTIFRKAVVEVTYLLETDQIPKWLNHQRTNKISDIPASTTLHVILDNPIWLISFKEFLAAEFASENLCFVREVSTLQQSVTELEKYQIEHELQRLCKKYINEESQMELNISPAVRTEIRLAVDSYIAPVPALSSSIPMDLSTTLSTTGTAIITPPSPPAPSPQTQTPPRLPDYIDTYTPLQQQQFCTATNIPPPPCSPPLSGYQPTLTCTSSACTSTSLLPIPESPPLPNS
ncbi:hypothetical protein Pelo_17990 [Pelomyxa schiedti]|nr:hypothetical protein Pelo_17990 [Pelomyxa schiedti]